MNKERLIDVGNTLGNPSIHIEYILNNHPKQRTEDYIRTTNYTQKFPLCNDLITNKPNGKDILDLVRRFQYVICFGNVFQYTPICMLQLIIIVYSSSF